MSDRPAEIPADAKELAKVPMPPGGRVILAVGERSAAHPRAAFLGIMTVLVGLPLLFGWLLEPALGAAIWGLLFGLWLGGTIGVSAGMRLMQDIIAEIWGEWWAWDAGIGAGEREHREAAAEAARNN